MCRHERPMPEGRFPQHVIKIVRVDVVIDCNDNGTCSKQCRFLKGLTNGYPEVSEYRCILFQEDLQFTFYGSKDVYRCKKCIEAKSQL